jgi:hypothetical protein
MTKQRGRQSPAAFALQATGLMASATRPDAPYDLTDEQADEWRAIVGSMPADYFVRASFPILSQLCRHIVAAGQVAQMIKLMQKSKKEFNYKDFAALLQQQAAESLAIMRLSRSLRLTPQSTKNQHISLPKGGVVIDAPWERDE